MSKALFLSIVLFGVLNLPHDLSGQESGQQTKANADKKSKSKMERQTPFQVRPFSPIQNGYKARGISYGPFRKGQSPGGTGPSRKQIQEDLHLLTKDQWQMIRLYGTEPFARVVCEVIKADKLPIKVMIGAWIATEKDQPKQRSSNQGQVERAIKIANDFPEIVCAVSVANESQVFWSFHKVDPKTLIQYVRQVRSAIKQPITVADDFNYWITKESQDVASELDFIVTHIYAMWLGEQLENALTFTQDTYKKVCAAHPDRTIVIGEGGWATKKANSGDQSRRIKGTAGEQEQKQFYDEYTAWLLSKKIPFFYFEAFDEPWKGGADPNDVEKHWGLFREDRTRKPAVMK